MSQVEIKPLGDDGILIRFKEEISIKINRLVQNLKEAILIRNIQGVKELVPSYRSLLIFYDQFIISFDELNEILINLLKEKKKIRKREKKVFEIPVYFGNEVSVDLPYIAKIHNLSEEDVIKILLKRVYYVYMYGFLPGFIYLGGLPKILKTPRLESPRVLIPKGSIGIGGEQLGIYSISSPGGFRIFGITYLDLFEVNENLKVKISEGDFIKFRRVSKDEFIKNYKVEIKFYD